MLIYICKPTQKRELFEVVNRWRYFIWLLSVTFHGRFECEFPKTYEYNIFAIKGYILQKVWFKIWLPIKTNVFPMSVFFTTLQQRRSSIAMPPLGNMSSYKEGVTLPQASSGYTLIPLSANQIKATIHHKTVATFRRPS